jgi:hypothetical protein
MMYKARRQYKFSTKASTGSLKTNTIDGPQQGCLGSPETQAWYMHLLGD